MSGRWKKIRGAAVRRHLLSIWKEIREVVESLRLLSWQKQVFLAAWLLLLLGVVAATVIGITVAHIQPLELLVPAVVSLVVGWLLSKVGTWLFRRYRR